MLIDLCHPMYLMAQFLGMPTAVAGVLGHVTGRAVEDNAAAMLTYSSGAIGVVETSSVSSVTPFSIEIHGTEGSIVYTEPGIGALVASRGLGAAMQEGPDDVRRLRVRSPRLGHAEWQDILLGDDPPSALRRWRALAASGEQDTENVERALMLTALVEAAYVSASQARTEPAKPLWLTHPHA